MRTFWLLGLVLTISCSTPPKVKTEQAHRDPRIDLSVRYVQSREAELEPCGCSMMSLGGFPREANLIESWAATDGKYRISLTSGETFLNGHGQDPKGIKPEVLVKARYVARGLSATKLDALSVSAKDLALGMSKIRELQKGASFKMLSANLFSKSDGAPLFDLKYEIDGPGRKIVVTGIAANPPKGWVIDKNARVADPITSLGTVFAGVPQGAFVIVLNDLAEKERNTLMKHFPRIRMLLGADPETPPLIKPLVFEGKMLDFNMPTRAQHVQRINVQMGSPEQPFDLKNGLFYSSERGFLGSTFDEPRNALHSLIDEYKAEIRAMGITEPPGH